MAQACSTHHFALFMAGMGIGALVGVLSAPKSGRETRDVLVNGAREGTEFIRTSTRKAADGMSALVGKGRSRDIEFPASTHEYAGG